MYTFLQLKNAVLYAAGSTLDAGVTTPRVTAGMVVNRAIDHIERAFNWTWLRTTTTLDLTNAQDYIILPSGLNELLGVHLTTASAALAGGLRRVSVEEFLRIKAYTYPVPYIGYMIMGSSAASNTAEALRRISIAPTPTATTVGGVRIIYLRSLHRFPVDDSVTTEDTYLPDLPSEFTEILFTLCRAFATETLDEQVGSAYTEATGKLATLVASDKRLDAQSDNAPQSIAQNMLRPYAEGFPSFFTYTYQPIP